MSQAPVKERWGRGHAPAVLWFTGLSGSGKTTLCNAVEPLLRQRGCQTVILDGDILRGGLCSDLGFSIEDRQENIRRTAEISAMLVQSGLTVLVALISPFASDRQRARQLIPSGHFHEIHCDSSLAECEQRDVKGLYRRARAGEIKQFSGMTSPYEPPAQPELVLHTARDSVEKCAQDVVRLFDRHQARDSGVLS